MENKWIEINLPWEIQQNVADEDYKFFPELYSEAEKKDWSKRATEFYDKQTKEFNEKNKNFCGLGLNKVGTLIEVEYNGKTAQHLIGSVNSFGNNDPGEYSSLDGVIVKRYKIVWSVSDEK